VNRVGSHGVCVKFSGGKIRCSERESDSEVVETREKNTTGA
jgi:hypothetical protein